MTISSDDVQEPQDEQGEENEALKQPADAVSDLDVEEEDEEKIAGGAPNKWG